MEQTKMQLVDLLVEDYKKMFPNYTRAEVSDLRRRLFCFEIEDLKLLVSQL